MAASQDNSTNKIMTDGMRCGAPLSCCCYSQNVLSVPSRLSVNEVPVKTRSACTEQYSDNIELLSQLTILEYFIAGFD